MSDCERVHQLPPEGIETRRLRIRRFVPSDVDDLLAVVSHPSVAAETPNIPHEIEGLAEYVNQQNRLTLFEPHACIDFAIERKADQRVVGLVTSVSNGNRQSEIGWAIGVDYRGHGFATEAARGLIAYLFATHNDHRIFAGTIYTNTASWAVMERLGMRKEAHFVKAHPPMTPGEAWIDTVRYAVLAEEWPVDESG